MMNRYFVLPLLVIAAACANQTKAPSSDGGWDVVVSGKVAHPGNGKIRIEELTMGESGKIDSATVGTDGTYSATIHVQHPGFYRINFDDRQVVDVVVDSTNFVLNVDGADQSGPVEIKGSPDYDLIRDVQQRLVAFQEGEGLKQLEAQFEIARQANNEVAIVQIQNQYMEQIAKAHGDIIASLEDKPVTLGLINLLQGNTFDKDNFYSFYERVANRIPARVAKSEFAKQFKDMVVKMAITAVGQPAPEIALPDPSGKVVALSSLKGKYVLVDFWAKWCGPCRRENPNVVKAYKKFKDKGFEVFGVSLDRTKEDWVQAIQQDGLTWTHVSDLKYFESQAAIDYNINAIPFSILLDPNGIIIAKNLRGVALDKKLEEVFAAKKKS